MLTEDDHTIEALRNAWTAEVRARHLDADAALERARGAARAPVWRSRRVFAMAAAGIVVLVAAGSYVARETRTGHSTPPAGTSACTNVVHDTALPVWARDGFSPGAYVEPHVIGAGDEIVGILFVNPLRVRQPTGTNNKILWVARRRDFGALAIRAHLEGSSRTATRTVPGGPGPSVIDLPAPGCWLVTLSWSGHTATTALPYSP